MAYVDANEPGQLSMQSQTYTIAELANEFGLSLRTLRFYEQRGLLSPERVGTSRYYRNGDKVRLQVILKGKRLGLSLDEIERLITSAPTVAGDNVIVDGLSTDEIEAKLIACDEQVARLNDLIRQLGEVLESRRMRRGA